MHHRIFVAVACAFLVALAACGSSGGEPATLATIAFETTAVPPGGAGQLYNVVVRFAAEGGAVLPDQFSLVGGVLPPGVQLTADLEDRDGDGLADLDGAPTGHARLLGYPREVGSFTFTIKAISTGGEANPSQPDLSATSPFTITIGPGSVAILTPTADEGTTDPAVPALDGVVPFVNPADPSAFYSFAFETAGGSRDNVNAVYMPRELELSVFDAAVVADGDLIDMDFDEGATSGDSLDPDFSDGGLFWLQAGPGKVQIGGFQSPRGPVGTLTRHGGGPGLDPVWFQRTPEAGGPARNARRDLADTAGLAGGDTTLGAEQPVRFSDYFDPAYEHTDPSASPRRTDPFTADQYRDGVCMRFVEGVRMTPLRYRVIVEAVDTRGTVNDRLDDVIARKAFVVQIQIPDIRIDTVVLADGTAGVDYTEFVTASGGVPALSYELEYVDAVVDGGATAVQPGHLDRAGLGLALDTATGQFFGVPRVDGTAEVTVRVYAAVLNPTQGGSAAVPTGTAGELDGTHPLTGKTGRHRTLTLDIGAPTPLVVANKGLAPGVDGLPYPGDRLEGAGGVPSLLPDPVDFSGTYPSATALRNYAWSARYTKDSSHPDAGAEADGLPNALTLDGDPASTGNGEVTGVTTDRGFHPVTLTVTDVYRGSAGAPDPGAAVTTEQTIALSVSPDSAVYMRGLQSGEGSGGQASGLLDATAQMGEARMVPMFLASTLVKGSTGEQPEIVGAMSPTADLLPLMLANGGSDANVDKSGPSIAGFWPAESNKQDRWWYYYYGYNEQAFKHLQQETCWIQTPTGNHARVFLWGDTKIKQFTSGSSTSDGKRYQVFDTSGKRGVLVVDPLTGDFWIPAILDNTQSGQDGSQFGAEYVLSCTGYSPTHSSYGYVYGCYERYYGYAAYMRGTREVHLQGLGSYLESGTRSSNGRLEQGRTAVSVAASADGVWCATALPGGDEPKLLLWRTDKQPIPAAMLAQSHVRGLSGVDAAGASLPNASCVVDLGGASASGITLGSNPRYLLPDSLMFVRDGLLFLMERQMNYVFGVSLVDGHLSAKSVNSRSQLVSGMSTGPSANSVDGMYIPDQDTLRGQKAPDASMVQFSFTGNRPAAGEEGPDKVAFVAGDNYSLYSFDDYNSTYVNLSSDSVRHGYAQSGNRRKALLFLETSTGAGGLDLAASVLKDLTGNNSNVNGDLLTPGRPGEELDFLAVSPDGKYVAVVRDDSTFGTYRTTYYGRNPSFSTVTTSSTTSYYRSTDDILLVSTEGKDMDSGTSAVEPVLFLGSGNYSASFSGTPSANSASYARAASWLNAKGRRICGVTFGEDGRTLVFHYAGDNTYWTKYFGGSIQYGINAHSGQSTTYRGLSAQISLRFHFRTSSDGPIDFRSSSAAANFLKNNLQGLGGVGAVGDTSAPFTHTNPRVSGGSNQQFWATFRSADGRFLYMVSDGISGRNFLVGLNTTSAAINGREPFEPFSPHAATVGFEQFDVNAWNYDNRFAGSPAGVVNPASGRDASGILFLVASDASAGATSAVDLEVYVLDGNVGGDMVALTSDVTDGTANAINHLYASSDANILVGQRAETTANSGSSRTRLNNDNDLFVVANVHAVLGGAAPDAFVLSAGASHGSSVALVGEGTAPGPQALIFSSAASSGSNTAWDDRTLKIALLQPSAAYDVIDSTQSHYAVLAGGRKLDDDPDQAD